MAAQYGLPLSQIPHNPAVAAAAAPPTPAGANPNISNLITSLDGAGLQKLIGAIQQPQGPGAAPSVLTPDLARLLGGAPAHLHGQAQPPLYGQQTPAAPASNPYAALAANPALARLLSGAAPAGPGAPLHVQHHLPGGAPVHQQHQHQNQQHQHQHQHQHQQHPSHAPVPNQPDVQEIMAQLAKYRR